MAAPLPAAERIQHLRDALESIQPLLPSGGLVSPEPFRLSPRTIDDLRRLGPVLSRFRRTADLIHRRSSRGSLPAWISAMTDQGESTGAKDERPSIFRPSLKLTKKGLSLVGMDWQADLMALAARLQQLHSQMGYEVIGGSHGILDGADSVSGEKNGDLQAEWAPLDPPRQTSLWLALLWSAPLQSVWARELRSSNLKFLRKFVPLSWAVDPTPLPHQAVLPRLGVRSFADLTLSVPGIADLTLKPAAASLRGQREIIWSQAPASEWAAALDHAMEDFGRSPWLLWESHEGETVEQPGWNSGLESAQPVSGGVTLTPYYFEKTGQTTLGGVLATIEPCMSVPVRSEGETGEILSVLAPCAADAPP